MTEIQWDQVGERTYETGVNKVVLYKPVGATYPAGYAWNGVTNITESPTGAEATGHYADDIKYLNLVSAEEWEGSLEAFTYPKEFEECDGYATPIAGITVGQQTRKPFGLAYCTRKGNDTEGNDYGYKLHLLYGALAAPSEKAHETINDSPEPVAFSWDISTTAVAVPGLKPSATLTLDSTEVDADALAALEAILYGTVSLAPRLPLPAEIFALFEGSLTVATPTEPTFDSLENEITIPTVTGVVYTIDGETVTGVVTITETVLVVAFPTAGYVFPTIVDNEWVFVYTP